MGRIGREKKQKKWAWSVGQDVRPDPFADWSAAEPRPSHRPVPDFFLSAAVNERDNQSICAFKTKNVSPKCVCVHTIKVIDSLKWLTNQRPPIKDNFFSTTNYQLICMKILRLVEENEVDFSKKVSTRSVDYKSRYKLFKINSEIIHF